MLERRFARILTAGAACLLLGCARTHGRRAERLRAPPASRLALELAGGRAYELRAIPERRAVAPQLHLWDEAARRELAHATAGWLSREVRLSFRTPDGPQRRYQLLLTAGSAAHSGDVSLYLDGARIAQHAPAGGRGLSLLLRPGHTYQAAAAPGGTRRALLLGLDRAGALIAFDERSGPTGLPKLAHRSGLSRLIAASLEAEPGALRVFANDAEDHDGDGLGRELERALGSCDAPDDEHCRTRPLARYYTSVPQATRDSDRDGLPDAAELLGVSAAALDLPRYGVDLLHKDVLVELDHRADLPDVGFSEAELAEVAGLFMSGSAADLYNPDGRPGVRLHFDAGFAPRERAHLTLLGDFAGSGASQARDYRAARAADFTPARAGYFRYAFVTRQGRGQARGDALTVNRDLQRVAILAHELGHTLGLSHHGHDSWGKANCKPNYFSIMNYLYQNRVEIGFSRRATSVLDPLSVRERAAADSGSASASALREPPLELDVRGADVDWNRDGLISERPVRAGLTWATYKSCGAAEHGLVRLAESAARPATPVLLRSASRLYALWLDSDGRPSLRSTGLGPLDGSALCEGGAGGCEPWSPPLRAADVSGWQHLAAAVLDSDTLLLAVIDAHGGLLLRTLDPRTARVTPFGALASAAHSAHRPALAWAQVAPSHYGAHELLMLLVRDTRSGQLQQYALSPDGALAPARWALDGERRPIVSALGPSLLALPSGELCGVFPDPDGYVRIYAYDRGNDLWIELTRSAFAAGLGPRTLSEVGMAFHRYRAADGGLVDPIEQRGALYLSFAELDTSVASRRDNPHFYVSEWLSERHSARGELTLRWRGRVLTEWTKLVPGTGVALFEDAALSSLKSLLWLRSSRGDQLVFLPFADGAYAAQLSAGNDFQVMERAICSGLKGSGRCGGPSSARY